MGFTDKIRGWLGRTKKGLANPYVVPRQSRDGQFIDVSLLDQYILPATFPFAIFDLITQVAVTDPYVSKFVQTTVSLGMGSGHNLYVTANNEALANEAIDASNEFAERVSPYGGGMDGVQASLLRQLALTAACCIEWTPNTSITSLERGFLVPIKTLRFRYADSSGTLELVQLQNNGELVALNPIQTVYHALTLRDDSPYPIPPIVSALEACDTHRVINRQIKTWMQKISALGVLLAEVEPPPRESGETQGEYDSKAATYLEAISETVKDNLDSGIGIGYNNIKFSFQNTQSSAQGAKDILQVVLQGLFAGLQRDPIFFGWDFSSSDSKAKVVYEEMLRNLNLYQLGVKKCLEHGYRLNLAFNGLGDIGIAIEHNNDFLKDVFKESEAKQMVSQAVVMQLEAGIIDQTEARRALGLDDRTIKSGAYTAAFNHRKGRYELTPYARTTWQGIETSAQTGNET